MKLFTLLIAIIVCLLSGCAGDSSSVADVQTGGGAGESITCPQESNGYIDSNPTIISKEEVVRDGEIIVEGENLSVVRLNLPIKLQTGKWGFIVSNFTIPNEWIVHTKDYYSLADRYTTGYALFANESSYDLDIESLYLKWEKIMDNALDWEGIELIEIGEGRWLKRIQGNEHLRGKTSGQNNQCSGGMHIVYYDTIYEDNYKVCVAFFIPEVDSTICVEDEEFSQQISVLQSWEIVELVEIET